MVQNIQGMHRMKAEQIQNIAYKQHFTIKFDKFCLWVIGCLLKTATN